MFNEFIYVLAGLVKVIKVVAFNGTKFWLCIFQYAIVSKGKQLIKNSGELKNGDQVHVTLNEGSFDSEVLNTSD